MRKLTIFIAGVAVGLVIAGLSTTLSLRAQALAPIGNGDVNGDGQIDIADAVTLLNWLFKGGTPPVPIECNDPGTQKAKFRLLNDLVCQNVPFPAPMEVCGAMVTDSFEEANLPTACTEITSTPNCGVRMVVETANCGSFDFCGNFNAAPNHVFDFVLTVVENDRLALGYLVQELLPNGDCPPFPTGGTFVGEIVGTCAPAAQAPAGGAGGGAPSGFTASGSWGR